MGTDFIQKRPDVVGDARHPIACALRQTGIPQPGHPLQHRRRALANDLERNGVECEVAEEWPGEADIRQAGAVTQQEWAMPENRLQLFKGAQENRLHIRDIITRDPVAGGIATALSAAQIPSQYKVGQRGAGD